MAVVILIERLKSFLGWNVFGSAIRVFSILFSSSQCFAQAMCTMFRHLKCFASVDLLLSAMILLAVLILSAMAMELARQ
jgi:hypothetical protein